MNELDEAFDKAQLAPEELREVYNLEGLSWRLEQAGFTHRSAGNERRMEHEVLDAKTGDVVFTGSDTAIAKWLALVTL